VLFICDIFLFVQFLHSRNFINCGSKISTALILWDGALTPRNFMKMFDIIDTAEKPLGLSLSPANGDTITIVVWPIHVLIAGLYFLSLQGSAQAKKG
jgi:hypothetical protein